MKEGGKEGRKECEGRKLKEERKDKEGRNVMSLFQTQVKPMFVLLFRGVSFQQHS